MRRVEIFTRTIRYRNLADLMEWGARGVNSFLRKSHGKQKYGSIVYDSTQNSQEMGRVFQFLLLFLYVYFSIPPFRTPKTQFQPACFSAWRLWYFLLHRKFLELDTGGLGVKEFVVFAFTTSNNVVVHDLRRRLRWAGEWGRERANCCKCWPIDAETNVS